MNVIVRTREPGFVENDWVGCGLQVGDSVQLAVSIPDPRCVMPTLVQEDLPKDNGILDNWIGEQHILNIFRVDI